MSVWNGVPAVVIYAGPPQNYPAAAAAVTTAQSLVTGASGGFSQALIPSNFWSPGSNSQLIEGTLAGIVTGQASATTAIITIGLVSAANSVAGTTIIASPAMTVTSFSNQPWMFNFQITTRTVGYGTSAVSTTLLTTGTFDVQTGTVGTVSRGVCTPTTVTTIDASAGQYMYATVTFNTASATNSCTLEQVILLGSMA